jgi:hypothetical protein
MRKNFQSLAEWSFLQLAIIKKVIFLSYDIKYLPPDGAVE